MSGTKRTRSQVRDVKERLRNSKNNLYLDDLTTEDQNGESKQKQTKHKKRNSKGGKKGEEEGNNFIDTEEVAENVTDAKRMVTDKRSHKTSKGKKVTSGGSVAQVVFQEDGEEMRMDVEGVDYDSKIDGSEHEISQQETEDEESEESEVDMETEVDSTNNNATCGKGKDVSNQQLWEEFQRLKELMQEKGMFTEGKNSTRDEESRAKGDSNEVDGKEKSNKRLKQPKKTPMECTCGNVCIGNAKNCESESTIYQ